MHGNVSVPYELHCQRGRRVGHPKNTWLVSNAILSFFPLFAPCLHVFHASPAGDLLRISMHLVMHFHASELDKLVCTIPCDAMMDARTSNHSPTRFFWPHHLHGGPASARSARPCSVRRDAHGPVIPRPRQFEYATAEPAAAESATAEPAASAPVAAVPRRQLFFAASSPWS